MFRNCLFSPIEGVLTDKGQPLVGLEVVRSCLTNGTLTGAEKRYSDSCTTDDEGRFRFGSLNAFYPWTWTPAQIHTDQLMYVDYRGRRYELWKNRKGGHFMGDEIPIDGSPMPIQITCDLTDPDATKIFLYSRIDGICKILNVQEVDPYASS
ncbi:MAG: DUF6795 domain-containing protein [Planctomycetota bacterium]